MCRIQLNNLNAWFDGKTRKPLILSGARQVGKSTLVRQFAAERGKKLVEINLEKQRQLDDIFKTLDVTKILDALAFLPNTERIDLEHSILFLDEIQATPYAIAALRYFYEDKPTLPVICAGSLLDFTLSDHKFSIPVGRIEYLHLGPMTFNEFLLASNNQVIAEHLEAINDFRDFSDTLHERCVELLKKYFFIGGMPEAVKAYALSQNLRDVSSVHRSIIDTYKDDFAKYAKDRDLVRLHYTLNYAAKSVGEKVKYVDISRDDKSADLKHVVDLLSYARVISKIYHTDATGIPIGAEIDDRIFKLLFLDVGLMNYICGLNWNAIDEQDAIKLVNSGNIAQQFVGQEILSTIHESRSPLYYWVREGKSQNAEVDYLIQDGTRVVPLEVKAGGSGHIKSLGVFAKERKNKIAVRFDLNKPSRVKVPIAGANKNFELISLPLYFAGFHWLKFLA